MSCVERLVQISTRGQVTLPAALRRSLGLRAGDTILVRIDEGRIVLEPIESYDDDRIAEFDRASTMSKEELERVRSAWSG